MINAHDYHMHAHTYSHAIFTSHLILERIDAALPAFAEVNALRATASARVLLHSLWTESRAAQFAATRQQKSRDDDKDSNDEDVGDDGDAAVPYTSVADMQRDFDAVTKRFRARCRGPAATTAAALAAFVESKRDALGT
jgi:hypothetical protein